MEDAPAIARVHVDSWRTTYREIISEKFLAGLSYEDRTRRWEEWLGRPGAGHAFVVEDLAGHVVGFANGGPERSGDPRYKGELYAIYIEDMQQRKGLGRQLVLAVADAFLRTNMSSMLVWVLVQNHGARNFYEALGGQHVREQPIEIGGTTLTEVAYGWPDLVQLITAASV